MTDVLDRDVTRLARWKRGPDPEKLEKLLGEPPLGIRLERVHFPSKRPVQLVFAVMMRSGLEAAVFGENCADEMGAVVERTTASLNKSRKGQKRALAAAPIVGDPASNLVLRRPGLDERLPGLKALHDLSFARETVARLTERDPGPVKTKLMAHRLGKRAVIRIDFNQSRVFARVRAIKSNEGKTRLARHCAIWEALGPDSSLTIPEPLGALPQYGLSLFGDLPGASPDFNRDHTAVAHSLDILQCLKIDGFPLHSGADESLLLRDWHLRCQIYHPELATSLTSILERTYEELEVLVSSVVPCHRDLHEKQIHVHNGRAGFLDFDTLSMSDPGLDPGNLMAHLFFAGLDERPIRSALGDTRSALWRRATLLRLAMIYAFTSTPDSKISKLLQELGR